LPFFFLITLVVSTLYRKGYYYTMSVWCDTGSGYSGSHEWRPVSIQVKNASPALDTKASSYQGYQDSRHRPALRSPKKRLRPKTPTPPATPKFNITTLEHVYYANNSSSKGTGPVTNPNMHHEPLFLETPSTDLMKIAACPEVLEWRQLLQLRDQNEGTYRVRSITNDIMAKWVDQHSEVLESDDLRYEYNYLSQCLHIQCMALPTHESLHIYFANEVVVSLAERFGKTQVRNMVVISGSGTSMSCHIFFLNSI